MEIYGKNPAWFALCSTPGLGGVISFCGLTKWACEAAELERIQKIFEQARSQPVTAVHARARSEEEVPPGLEGVDLDELEQKTKIVQNSQAFYAIAGAISSVLSLALSIQAVAAPVFAAFAIWTVACVFSAYCAATQVDRDAPYSVSFMVNFPRTLQKIAML